MQKKLRNRIAIGVLLAGLSGLSLYLNSILNITTCPISRTIGVPCPTCGTTRAWLAFFQGDFEHAFQLHPLFILIPLFFVLFLFYDKIAKKSKRLAQGIIISCLVLLVGVWIFRMITMFPHTDPMVWNEHSIVSRIIAIFS